MLALLGLDTLATTSSPHLALLEDRKYTGETIGSSSLPTTWKQKYTQPQVGVKRTFLNLGLKNAVLEAGIELREGWKLVDVDERDGKVVAISEDGRREEGDFLVGCDGIHSSVREVVLRSHGVVGREEVEFTGLTQVCLLLLQFWNLSSNICFQTAAITTTPDSLKAVPTMLNIYGPSTHLIAYPVSPTQTSLALTQRSLTSIPETWKKQSPSTTSSSLADALNEFSTWASPVPELLAGAKDGFIKFGLFDRKELPADRWLSESGRIVLIGDAAHPTSPHLGQGANQALEDCYFLFSLLPDFTSLDRESDNLDTDKLREVFTAFAEKRQPRTSILVKGARKLGELRVMGIEGAEGRDEILRKGWEDTEALESKFRGLFSGPF